MTNARRLTRLAATALVLVAVGGCAHGNDPAASGSPSPSSPAPTTPTRTTSSPTPPSDSQVASEAASAVVRKYYGTLDRVRRHLDLPLTQLSTVATSVELSSLKTLVRDERAQGQHQTGSTKVAVLRVQSVNLDNSDPAAGRVPTVEIDVCWDVDDVDIVNAKGHSVVSPGRPNTGWTRMTVANYHFADAPGEGWRVATSQDLKRTPCAAS